MQMNKWMIENFLHRLSFDKNTISMSLKTKRSARSAVAIVSLLRPPVECGWYFEITVHTIFFFLSACTHTHHQEEEWLRWIWLNGALSHERECISGWQRKPTNCNHLKNIIDFKPKSKRTLYHSNQEIDGHEKKTHREREKTRKKPNEAGNKKRMIFIGFCFIFLFRFSYRFCLLFAWCLFVLSLLFVWFCSFFLPQLLLFSDVLCIVWWCCWCRCQCRCHELFFFILSAPLFASSVHTSARSSTIPSKENIQQMFTGVHTLRCDFSRYNWRFFFRFVRNRLFGFFKLFHGKPCILTYTTALFLFCMPFLKKKV